MSIKLSIIIRPYCCFGAFLSKRAFFRREKIWYTRCRSRPQRAKRSICPRAARHCNCIFLPFWGIWICAFCRFARSARYQKPICGTPCAFFEVKLAHDEVRAAELVFFDDVGVRGQKIAVGNDERASESPDPERAQPKHSAVAEREGHKQKYPREKKDQSKRVCGGFVRRGWKFVHFVLRFAAVTSAVMFLSLRTIIIPQKVLSYNSFFAWLSLLQML